MKDFRKDAKVLGFDLECSPNLGWFYDCYDTTPIKIEQPQILLAVSWKWLGDKGKSKCKIISDYKQMGAYDDDGIVRELWRLLDEAQIVYAHNGARFDSKMANAFFLRHKMTPPSPYKVVDTLQMAKRYFKFGKNNLDYLGKLLIGEGKTETTYGACWDKMLHGTSKEKKKYGELMRKYCANDTDLLEKIYYKLLPWMNNHPNMALYAGQEHICPRCGFESEFKIEKYRRTGAQVNAIQFQCKRCGGYVTRKLTPEEREELLENGRLKSIYRNIV